MTCSVCKNQIDETENFCTQCGASVSQTITTNSDVTAQVQTEAKPNKSTSKKGKLVLPDDSEIEIDQSQRLVGRADLKRYSQDPSLISRGHFTVYEENGKYYIMDGKTVVQDKESKNHTYINEEDITGKKNFELTEGVVIQVSDVKISFKLGDNTE